MIINIHDDIIRIRAMKLLDKILKDKTTGRNIVWATDAYNFLGGKYEVNDEITSSAIIGTNFKLIKTRARKNFEQQNERTKQHAEVFTPMWVCKMMNDYLDDDWFGAKDVFFKDGEPTAKVIFPEGKDWKQYVDSRRLEITCGEAPYLVSRYDVETGEMVPINKRIGILDRKLRVVSENAKDEEEWLKWALRAFQATYGYEFQGDNLLIARINCLMTFEDYMKERWQHKPESKDYAKVLNVIVWNIWQMDGLKGVVPYINTDDSKQMSLFDMLDNDNNKNSQPDCLIHNWRRQRTVKYLALQDKGADIVKFDYIIGNPPYQDEITGDNKTFAPPIYHKFIDESYKIADVVELIHPARFLFNAGSTPKEWNKKMLEDEHLKVIEYKSDSGSVFANTDIKGGVAITYHDVNQVFGATGVFTPFEELNSILHKVYVLGFKTFKDIVVTRTAYRLTPLLHEEHPEAKNQLSNGHLYDMSTNIFERLPQIFFDYKPDDENEYIQMYGLENKERCLKFIKKAYVNEVSNLECFKIFVPAANGSGAIGEVLSTPLIGAPLIGATETFISIGKFHYIEEAEACFKYIKSKFARTMLGILKITQHNPPEKWYYVPMQDFTPNSDIDWTKSIKEIDQQLYKKYGLDESEIEFIETHVKEME